MVNSKGIKLALKNLGLFSSPTAFRAVLRDKYQHFDIYLKKNIKIYQFCVKKYQIKVVKYLNFKGQKCTRKAKNPIFVAIIF